MGRTLEIASNAKRTLKKLPRQMRERITALLARVLTADNPKRFGKALRCGGWRYRIGKYRVICQMNRERLIVQRIGKRDAIYL